MHGGATLMEKRTEFKPLRVQLDWRRLRKRRKGPLECRRAAKANTTTGRCRSSSSSSAAAALICLSIRPVGQRQSDIVQAAAGTAKVKSSAAAAGSSLSAPVIGGLNFGCWQPGRLLSILQLSLLLLLLVSPVEVWLGARRERLSSSKTADSSAASTLPPLDANSISSNLQQRRVRRQTEIRPDDRRSGAGWPQSLSDSSNDSGVENNNNNNNTDGIAGDIDADDVISNSNSNDNDAAAAAATTTRSSSKGTYKQSTVCEFRYSPEANGNNNNNNNNNNSELADDESADESGVGVGGAISGDGAEGGVAGGSPKDGQPEESAGDLAETVFQGIIYCIFIILFLIGVSTNALTLYAVGRKRLLAPMDIYIIALAINDLIYCLFALPIPPLYVLYYGEWVFGKFGCKAVAFLTSFSVHNSSLIVVNIAQLRFRLVVHPFEPKVSTLKAYLRSLLACSLASIITIPYVLVVHHYEDEECGRSCDEYWGLGEEGKWRRFLFSLFTTTVQFLLPLIGFEYYYKPIRDKLILMERTHSHAVALKAKAAQRKRRRAGPATAADAADDLDLDHNHGDDAHGHHSSPPPPPQSSRDSPPSASGQHQQHWRLHQHPLGGGGQVNQQQQQQLELSEIKSSSASSSALALNQLGQTQTLCYHVEATSTSATAAAADSNNNNSNNSTTNTTNISAASASTSTSAVSNQHGGGAVAAAAKASGCNSSSSERERIRQMNLLSRLKQTRKVVYFFSFTWLPLNVFNLIEIWVPLSSAHVYVHLLVQAAACGGVCLNPLMYPLSNDNYRQEFEHILPVCLIRKLDSLLKA